MVVWKRRLSWWCERYDKGEAVGKGGRNKKGK